MPISESQFQYLNTDELREGCGDLTENDFSEAHLAEIISNWEVAVHKSVGRNLSSPWLEAEENFSLVKQSVLFGSKSQVYEEMDGKDAESTKAFERYEYFLALLKDVTAGDDSSGEFQDTQGIDGFTAI